MERADETVSVQRAARPALRRAHGGRPGAGKTAVLELIQRSFCGHVRVLPESAGILFGGGFPRGRLPRIPRAGSGYNQRNPLRIESAAEAPPA